MVSVPVVEEGMILLEEASFMVVNKPAGLLTQAPPDVPSFESSLRELLMKRPLAPAHPFVGLPHRLDRGTSGVLLVAKNERSLRRFGDQFQSRKIEKFYLALCEGHVEQEKGTWIDFVRKVPEKPIAEVVPKDHAEGREAILHFESVWTDRMRTLLKIQLETGRMHQIRVQAAERGFPVVGDWCYGSQSSWGELDPQQSEQDRNHRQQLALHAYSIAFRHPQTAKPVFVSAPLPLEWKSSILDVYQKFST